MAISSSPHTCLFLVAFVVAMATCSTGHFDGAHDKVSLTDGRETVTWQRYRREASADSGNGTNVDVQCTIVREEASIESEGHKVVRRSVGELQVDKTRCLEHERRRRQVMLGSLWCGNGNTADSYDDLGYFSNVDKCCRAHDHCDRYVPGESTKYGVTNDTPYTWSDCKCDDTFRDCLKAVDSHMSYFVGKVFFDVATSSKCLDFDENDPTKARAVSKGSFEKRVEEEEEEKSWWDWFG